LHCITVCLFSQPARRGRAAEPPHPRRLRVHFLFMLPTLWIVSASPEYRSFLKPFGQALHREEGVNAGDGKKAGAVLGRHWPATPAAWETGRSGSERKPGGELQRVMRRYRLANTPPEKRKFLRKSQLWSKDFTAKLFCNVEFWIERLPKLIEHQPEFERLAAAGGSLLPRRRPSD